MLEVEGRATVALNMVSSLDGRAIVDGKSSSLGGDIDSAVFHRLRELCEALIVGDGTVNAENYQDLIQDKKTEEARLSKNLTREPLLALISQNLEINWQAPLFTKGEGEIIIYSPTAGEIPKTNTPTSLSVLPEPFRLAQVVEDLYNRGVKKILCEGGPMLHGQMQKENLLDEVFLTLAFKAVGGDPLTILRGDFSGERAFKPYAAYIDDSEMSLRLRREGL